MTTHEFTITEAQHKERIDKVLSNETSASRSEIRSLIENGACFLNDEEWHKVDHRLSEGDVVRISIPDQEAPEPIDPNEIKDLIVYEEDDMMVVNKPAGLLVHAVNDKDTTKTLAGMLVAYYGEAAEVGDDPSLRPGIVHRIDKGVSGIMVLAKTQNGFDHLKKQFKNRLAKKTYLAIVHGNMPEHSGTITLPIARSKTKGRMVARPNSQDGKEAITHYKLKERFDRFDYLEISIETGRTHQIRAHFHALDHPVIGDPLYTTKRIQQKTSFNPGRLFLHAAELEITLPSGERMTFAADVPDVMEEFLDKLR